MTGRPTRPSVMRALIVDDEAPARRRLTRLLATIEGVEIVGEAESGDEAVRRIAELEPDAYGSSAPVA